MVCRQFASGGGGHGHSAQPHRPLSHHPALPWPSGHPALLPGSPKVNKCKGESSAAFYFSINWGGFFWRLFIRKRFRLLLLMFTSGSLFLSIQSHSSLCIPNRKWLQLFRSEDCSVLHIQQPSLETPMWRQIESSCQFPCSMIEQDRNHGQKLSFKGQCREIFYFKFFYESLPFWSLI